MEVLVTTGAISRAKLQQNHHHRQTNIQLFTGRMPFLSPNQQCQSTGGKKSHSMDLLTPSSPGGLPTLSLTTSSSWLPRGRVAMPLISSLLPVPQDVGLLPAHGNGFGQIPFLLPPMTHQQELNPGSLGASPLPMSHRCCMECNRKSSEMTTV